MKYFPLIIALLSSRAYADDKIYEWILKQYEAKNETVIDKEVDSLIDGESHLVIVARDVDVEREADTSADK